MSIKEQIKAIFDSRNLNEIDLASLPPPETMLGVSKASSIFINAINENRKIAVVGDYDVDGICSLCIVERFFRKIGFSNYIIKIPNRFSDGYGINKAMIDELQSDIYVSVDNGISAFEVADYCNEISKIFIITDHHKPLTKDGIEILPNASVIINPNQIKCNFLQKEICGSMVAWYLCAGIKIELAKQGKIKSNDIDMREFSPYLSLSIISDIMPLTLINRRLYKLGIERINKSSEIPFVLLKEKFGNKEQRSLDSQILAFYIVPLLNSAGRVGSAEIAFRFLCSDSFNEAESMIVNLINSNDERRRLQSEVFSEARENVIQLDTIKDSFNLKELIKKNNSIENKENYESKIANKDIEHIDGLKTDSFEMDSIKIVESTDSLKATLETKNFIISFSQNFCGKKEGVLGIVASKLADEFNKSAFCFKLENGILKGSGRAKNGLNLIATITKGASNLLGFGGHSGAVGLSLKLENLQKFIKIIEQNIILDSTFSNKEQRLKIDINEIDLELLDLLQSYEPYGNSNEMLEFCASVRVIDSRVIGKDLNHQILKLISLTQNENTDSVFKCKNINLENPQKQNMSNLKVMNALLFNDTTSFVNQNVDISFFIQRGKFGNAELNITKIETY